MSRVLVTGGTSGLGRQVVQSFLMQGHAVSFTGREAVADVDLRFPASGAEARYVQCDQGNRAAVAAAWCALRDEGFVPDIVLLNAALQDDDLNSLPDSSAMQRLMDVNFAGTYEWVANILPDMVQRGGGVVGMVSSLYAYLPLNPRKATYAASKAAILSLARSLDDRYRSMGVRFLAFCPGPITEKGGACSVSSAGAARIVCRSLLRPGRHTVVNFPLTAFLAVKLFQCMPQSLRSMVLRTHIPPVFPD